MLRIVAQRRQIVVPSLFADYDAEALERKLVPLAEPSMTDGLAVLPPATSATPSSPTCYRTTAAASSASSGRLATAAEADALAPLADAAVELERSPSPPPPQAVDA